ncbi:protein bicaudal D-like isoform X1 [Ornithodoros turicata]|uniref:protein bicaudal D-like isoform X1 n=1 Tax=Ornithodoros turicata TaxID=34597 RepID=UPI00313892A9
MEVDDQLLRSDQCVLVQTLESEHTKLQAQCYEQEALIEAQSHELNVLREELAKARLSQKVSMSTGVEQEESLLEEKETKEASLTSKLQSLEYKLRQSHQEEFRLKDEKERQALELEELVRLRSALELERRNLRSDLREAKQREQRLLVEINDLEEQNVSLQKDVASLQGSQVEFEGAKHEVCQLSEEVSYLKSQLYDAEALREITEKKLEEALEAFQSEREQKYALRKELDQRLTSESPVLHLSGLSFTAFHLDQSHSEDGHHIDEDYSESDVPELQQLEADIINQPSERRGDVPATCRPATVNDLLSELHVTEIRKLEKQLEQLETEKGQVESKLEDALRQLDEANGASEGRMPNLARLRRQVNALANLHKEDYGSGDTGDLQKLKESLLRHEDRHLKALRLVEELQNDLNKAQDTEDAEEQVDRLRDQVANLINKIKTYEEEIADLKEDLVLVGTFTEDCQKRMGSAQEELLAASDELAQLYHHVCTVNGETPSRVVLDHAAGTNGSMDSAIPNVPAPDNKPATINSSALDTLRERLRTDHFRAVFLRGNTSIDPAQCATLGETLRDQVRHLRSAVETTLGRSRTPGDGTGEEDPQEQVIKLKSLLSTKREQIATLRAVLKANKRTAEIALANLKSKYETEKSVVSDTMVKLRHELKLLKEDAATFASLRAMFAARCEEYVARLDEQQRQLTAAEDERKTLNSLLRMAIQQKLALTQRLEDLEMDRERSHLRRGPRRGPTGQGGGSQRGSPHHTALGFFGH